MDLGSAYLSSLLDQVHESLRKVAFKYCNKYSGVFKTKNKTLNCLKCSVYINGLIIFSHPTERMRRQKKRNGKAVFNNVPPFFPHVSFYSSLAHINTPLCCSAVTHKPNEQPHCPLPISSYQFHCLYSFPCLHLFSCLL